MNDTDDSLQVGSKTWNKVMQNATKNGYRDGIEAGADNVLQKDFDLGYEDGFEVAFALGKFKALSILHSNTQHPDEIVQMLEKTRRGGCYICQIENTNLINEHSSKDIIQHNRQHTKHILNVLDNYFSTLLMKNDFNKLSI